MARQLCVFLLSVALLAGGKAFAQQTPLQTLYFLNPMGWNPAAAGGGGYGEVSASFRQQWLGLDGAPSTQWANVQLPLFYLRSGAGLQVVNDRLGALRRTEISGAWSYQVVDRGNFHLRAGVSVALVQAMLDGTVLRAPDGNYEGGVIDHNDGIIPDGRVGAWAPDAAVGVELRLGKLKMGVSATGLLAPRFMLSADAQRRIGSSRNVHFQAGWALPLGSDWSLEPMVLLRSDWKTMQLDAGCRALYRENLFVGLSFRGYSDRSTDALGIMAGMRLKAGFSLAYAYDAGLSALKNVHAGTHELVCAYRFNAPGKGRPPRIIYQPRFL
jgi:type IX secretion system PorP/SprF family membrane protein